MGIPTTCKVDYGKPAEGEPNITGSLEVIWNHKTGEPTDVVGFEIFLKHDGDHICFQSGTYHQGGSKIVSVLEEVLGESLIDAARNHCDHEPPTDRTVEEQSDYTEMLEDFYPRRPGH